MSGGTKGLGGVFVTPVNAVYAIADTSVWNMSSGYPKGVQDFRDLTAEECVDQLEQAIQTNPELSKAITLMNSKLYKALK